MNSDKFDRIVLDLLYGELDELTVAAAKRHMEQSARAREIYAHLKATRTLSVLPTHQPPASFEVSLLERERGALAQLPLVQRLGRVVSMLAGYAMRPQLSMGALLLLMIGSSLMFLRARPGQHSAVQVTERGVPEADVDRVIPIAPPPPEQTAQAHGVFELRGAGDDNKGDRKPSAPTPTARKSVAPPPVADAGDVGDVGLDPFDLAVQIYRAGHYVEAERRFERLSRSGGARAAEAALYSAQATRNASGCGPAVGRFERVRLRFPGSGSAYEAAWRAAKCLHQLGDVEAARQNYESLLQVGSHARRAQRALEALGSAPDRSVGAAPASERAARALLAPGRVAETFSGGSPPSRTESTAASESAGNHEPAEPAHSADAGAAFN